MDRPDMSKLHCRRGEIIFRQGDAGDCAYLVRAGTVRICTDSQDGRRLLTVMRNGDIFGEMGLLCGGPRSATAIAGSRCVLQIIRREDLEARLWQSDPIVAHLMNSLIARLRDGQHDMAPTTAGQQWARQAIDELILDNAIRTGLLAGEFEPFFQPIVRLVTGDTVGYEALARWRRTDGIVSPSAFLPVASRSSTLARIDRFVLDRSCGALAIADRNAGPGQPRPFVSVNMSPEHFANGSVVELVLDALKRHHLTPERIKVEITEHAPLADTVTTLETMHALRRAGIGLALDDFGTGYNALSSLHRLPISALKVDRSFIGDLETSSRTRAVVSSIIGMAQAMEVVTVVEGVEDRDVATTLRGMGCDYVQGYYFGHPIDQETMTKQAIRPATPPRGDR